MSPGKSKQRVIARRSMLMLGGLATMLVGCDKYFAVPYIDQLDEASPEDIHVLVNLQWNATNASCLPNARQKRDYMRKHGHPAEIVVIRIHDDTRTHAVVLSGSTIYDNGYLSDIPFDLADLDHYGRRIPWDPAWGEQ